MEEEAVHREHEMDALMQASMGDEEDHVSKNNPRSIIAEPFMLYLTQNHRSPGGR